MHGHLAGHGRRHVGRPVVRPPQIPISKLQPAPVSAPAPTRISTSSSPSSTMHPPKVTPFAPGQRAAVTSAASRAPTAPGKVQDTASLWKALHLRALNYDATKSTSDQMWILSWSRKIPRFTKGCACNEHWQKWYSQNLPDYSSSDAYFAWTVKAHNAVNERLRKPTFTVEKAKEHYTKIQAESNQ